MAFSDLDPVLVDLAQGYALGELSPAEMEAFERRLIDGDEAARRAFAEVEAATRAGLLMAADAGIASRGAIRPVAVEAAVSRPVPPRSPQPGQAPSAGQRPDVLARIGAVTGWLAAVAAAIAAAIIWISRPTVPVIPTGPDNTLAGLIARGAAELTIVHPDAPKFASGRVAGLDPADFAGIGGTAAWEPGSGLGVAEITGLPVNDAATWQYQAWVIDPAKGSPVPAGVFDVVANADGTTSVSVTFDPTLPIGSAAALAITIEPVGGQLEPNLDQLIAIASLPSGDQGGTP